MNGMKKRWLSVGVMVLGLLGFLGKAFPVLAFQAVLESNQVLRITQGEVLGETDNATLTEEQRRAEEARQQGKLDTIKAVPTIMNSTVRQNEPKIPVTDKKIRMKIEDDKGKMEIVESKNASGSTTQEFEDRYVKLQLLPTGTSRPQSTPAPGTTPRPTAPVIIQNSPIDANRDQLEIYSQDMRGLVEPGTELIVNPATNTISISVGDGDERPLNRLPDQAFQELTVQGAVFPEQYDEAKANLTLRTKDDGSVIYYTEITEERPVLGVIPRKMRRAYELNDQTGEIVTRRLPDESLLGRVLRVLGQ